MSEEKNDFNSFVLKSARNKNRQKIKDVMMCNKENRSSKHDE